MSGSLAPIKRGARGRPASLDRARAELATRLRARRPEIEELALTRIYAISDPAETEDPEYVDGLRLAVIAALDYGLAAVERGEGHAAPIPAVLLTQACIAARSGVSLDTVLRRYFAGYTLLGDFLIEEAERDSLLRGNSLTRLLRSQAVLFDRLITTVTEGHAREVGRRQTTSEQGRVARVLGLLAGELLDTTELAYDFDAYHLGVIADGPEAREKIRCLAGPLDCLPMVIDQTENTVWAWLGSRRPLDPDRVQHHLANQSSQIPMAIGEPAEGLGGWRLTHRQARAAFPIAIRMSLPCVRYADVALLASLVSDDLLATSLRELYLVPLEFGRDHGEALRQALRAYFTAERNVSSAAASLGVSRQVVAKRLRLVEERLGRSLGLCGVEMEAALRLESLGNNR